MDIKRQIEYWIQGAINDFDTARLLIQNEKILHGLFFCHLVIEKAIKAYVVKNTKEIPPKSHNLLYLTEKSDLILPKEFEIFFGIMMKYQLEGRYPDYQPEIPSVEVAESYLTETKHILKWIEDQL